MPVTLLTYNDQEQEHRGFGDTLGQLQAGVVKKTHTRDTTHAYYAGHELKSAGEEHPGAKGYYLKMDCTGSGKTKMGRSQNRIVVPVEDDGTLIEGVAYVWRHDDRILRLGPGFFTRARTLRKYLGGL